MNEVVSSSEFIKLSTDSNESSTKSGLTVLTFNDRYETWEPIGGKQWKLIRTTSIEESKERAWG